MKRFGLLCLLFALCCAWSGSGEVRYIDISLVSNVPIITLSNVEDMEAVIEAHQITLAYRTKKKTDIYDLSKNTGDRLYVIADGTYFCFFLNDYLTLEDYKAGKNASFKNGTDYYSAQKAGIKDAKVFYWYSASGNHFHSPADCLDAYAKGFLNTPSADYYKAQELGYQRYEDYKEFCDYTARGFQTKQEYEQAKAQGFYGAEEIQEPNVSTDSASSGSWLDNVEEIQKPTSGSWLDNVEE